jgi:hypothetical protein
MDYPKKLEKIAKQMRDEADNISPTKGTHPAPVLRRWADAIDGIASELSGAVYAPNR